jgi:hypothetical protein
MKLNRAWIWGVVSVLAVVVAVGIALPSFIRARQTSCSRACINNLRIIDAGKEQAVYNKELPKGSCVLPSWCSGFSSAQGSFSSFTFGRN